MLNRTAICTIACENYLPFVHILAASLVKYHPELPFFTLLISEDELVEIGAIENFAILQIKDLSAPQVDAMLDMYDQKQMSASLKPTLLKHLLKQGYATVVFIDPDMLVTSSLSQVIATVAQHSLTLTPHILHPDEASAFPNLDRALLQCGMFNAGFIGVTSAPEVFHFLDWWEKRLVEYCLSQPQKGMHYDQRWLDLAVGFVSDLHVLRDAGVNAAYWNLINRNVSFDGQHYHIDDSLLKCIHFSGFDPALLPQASYYFSEIDVRQFGQLAELFYQYKKDLAALGFTARPRAAESSNSAVQHGEGYFETALTVAEIQHLGCKAKRIPYRSLPRSAPFSAKFVPVSAFSISGIKKRYGWSDDEPWGVWSRGTYADLVIPVSNDLQSGLQISFLVQAFVSKLHPKQEVNVFLNGDFIEKWSFDRTDIPLFKIICANDDACLNGVVILGFQMLNPVSPLSLGVNSDSRVLGIGLQGLEVDQLTNRKAGNHNFSIAVTFEKTIKKFRCWLENQWH